MRVRGFSLLECLVGLALSLFVVCACLGFFMAAERSYFRLKDGEEAAQSALAALDKMRVDVARAGQGLASAAALGLIEPVVEADGSLLVTRSERAYALAADVAAGESRIPLGSVADLRAGREVLVADAESGEVLTLASVGAGAVVVSAPLGRGYPRSTASLQLLERVALSLDARRNVLRRRVNAGSPQPLLENAGLAEFAFDRPANLVRVRFSLAPQGEDYYELCLFPKNTALSRKR
ncbi:MAG TPA: hypothetical protein VMS75_11965 [Terriglobales bacterium]|nr:hypothetical protein [Terriglobales bacterium]